MEHEPVVPVVDEAPPPVAPLAPADLPAHREIGVKALELAPAKGTSSCYICEGVVPNKTWRVTYRFKRSLAMGHLRKVHIECCGLSDKASRPHDILTVASWKNDSDNSLERQAAADRAYAILSG